MTELRKSAKGRQCMVRIPGSCNFYPETTVLAHLNSGGIGAKEPDIFGAWCCSDCHNIIDGRVTANKWFGDNFSKDDIKLMHLEGIIRTQKIWLDEGLIKIGGGK